MRHRVLVRVHVSKLELMADRQVACWPCSAAVSGLLPLWWNCKCPFSSCRVLARAQTKGGTGEHCNSESDGNSGSGRHSWALHHWQAQATKVPQLPEYSMCGEWAAKKCTLPLVPVRSANLLPVLCLIHCTILLGLGCRHLTVSVVFHYS